MVAKGLEFLDVLAKEFESPEYRRKQVDRVLGLAKRAAYDAIALESMGRSEAETAAELAGRGDEELARLGSERARRIKREQYSKILEMCERIRFAVSMALGSDTIDETTADTGLDEDERVLIEQVSGRGCQW